MRTIESSFVSFILTEKGRKERDLHSFCDTINIFFFINNRFPKGSALKMAKNLSNLLSNRTLKSTETDQETKKLAEKRSFCLKSISNF